MKAKIYSFLAVLTFSALLSGCQSIANSNLQPSETPLDVTTASAADEQPAEPEATSKPFAKGQLYDLLVGELAGVRGNYQLALEKYTEQALQSRDVQIVERATRIANYSNRSDLTVRLALLWSELAPDDPTANQLSAISLAAREQLNEAFPHALIALQAGEHEALFTIAVIAERTDSRTRQLLIRQHNQAIQSLHNNFWLLLSKAMLLRYEKQLKEASAITKQSLKIKPDSEPANLILAQLHHELGYKKQAIELLKKQVDTHPDSKQLRVQYIKFLADSDLVAAKLEMERFLKENPDDLQLAYTVASTNFQLGLVDEARRGFLRLIQHPSASQQAYYQLGMLEQQQNNLEQAALYFRQVQTGGLVIPAAARASQLLSSMNQLPSARLHLQNLRRENPNKASTLFQIESEMLIEQQLNDDAFGLLNTALETFPDNISLLYARSIAGEKLNNFNQAEADLRTILDLDKNNAMALNALGYTLTLHTTRYQEAYELITQSLTIQPDEPATLDSLGWVLFHMGRHQEAIEQLEKAYSKLPDPEIAAHLGEVYWVIGNKTKAREIFDGMLSQQPDNPLILETLKRLQTTNPTENP